MIPGGVSSPVRAMRSVGRDHPLFVARGEGGWLIDADGNRYVDWVLSWGPLIAGHAHPRVIEAVTRTAAGGTSFGAPTALEVELATAVVEAVRSIDLVRFVSSGTEATMSAVRLARAHTGRTKILKFAGGYHGHVDALLAQAGSGLATLAIPSTPGVPAAVTADTLICEYNDLAAARTLLPGFLEGLRTICNGTGALLIADEVITGFRVAYGGAQERLAVRPDLTCLGKIVGGGLPAAAFGGRGDVMERLAPLGDVYQAGTLSGNPLAMAAGIVTLREIGKPGVFEKLERATAQLRDGFLAAARAADVPLQAAAAGSMWGFFFAAESVTDYATAKQHADTQRFGRFFHAMLDRGVYLAPSQFEAAFVSLAHDDELLRQTIVAAGEAFEVARG